MPVIVLIIALCACSLHGTGRPRMTPEGRLECTDDIGVPIFDTIVGATALVMGVYVYQDFKDHPDTRDNAYSVATPFLLTGALSIGSAIYGYRMVSRCRATQEALRTERVASRARRKEHKQAQRIAWQITKRAMSAARSGDCATVATLEGEVKNVDEDFHATVFRQDAAIARCLQPPAEPPAPPPDPSTVPPLPLPIPPGAEKLPAPQPTPLPPP